MLKDLIEEARSLLEASEGEPASKQTSYDYYSADALRAFLKTAPFPGLSIQDSGPPINSVRASWKVDGSTNSVVQTDALKKLKAAGFTDFKKGKFAGSSELGMSAKHPDGGGVFAKFRQKTSGGVPTTYASIETKMTDY